jgi:uncharacterized protein (TIGR02996 family)
MSDENAFLQAILAEPDNDEPRLVFADWLEERGDPLADFIRVQCALAGMSHDDPRRPELLTQTRDLVTAHWSKWAKRFSKWARRFGGLSPEIRFFRRFIRFFTMPVQLILDCPAFLSQVIPPGDVLVDLTGYSVPQNVIELIPESVARENVLLPLALEDKTILLAISEVYDLDALARVQFILNKDIKLILSEREQLIGAINRHYGKTELDSVECIFPGMDDPEIDFAISEGGIPAEPPAPGDKAHPVARLVDLIIREAISLGATALRIEPFADHGQVSYRLEELWVERDSLPSRLVAPVVSRFEDLATVRPAKKNLLRKGQFTVTFYQESFDLHVNSRWTVHGRALEVSIRPTAVPP